MSATCLTRGHGRQIARSFQRALSRCRPRARRGPISSQSSKLSAGADRNARSTRSALAQFLMALAAWHSSRVGSIFSNLDAPSQISAFVKLKLTNCAPISGWLETGFFMRESAIGMLTENSAGPLLRTSYEFRSTSPSPL
jgi:hypothetical protein